MRRFHDLPRISSWRRLSSAIWREHNSPIVYGFDEYDMSALLTLMTDLREQSGHRLTVTHFVVKALAEVFRRHPQLNVAHVRGRPMQRSSVDIYLQVAVPVEGRPAEADLGGVLIPDVPGKTIHEVADELAGRAGAVRTGTDEELEKTKKTLDRVPSGVLRGLTHLLSHISYDYGVDLSRLGVKPDPFGSAMVTNCGGFGVNVGLAPLLPIARTGVIVLLGRIEDRPVVADGHVVIRPIMRVGGTFDHRLFDGYQIGIINRELKSMIENPREIPGIQS